MAEPPTMYDHVLVPTDGSDAAVAAVDHALSIADRFDARVHALTVVDIDAVARAAPKLDLETLRETLRSEGETATGKLQRRADERGVPSTGAVVEADPATAILDAIADRDADLVVMGSHGRRGFDPYRVGSVTDRVVRRADVPVLVGATAHATADGTTTTAASTNSQS